MPRSQAYSPLIDDGHQLADPSTPAASRMAELATKPVPEPRAEPRVFHCDVRLDLNHFPLAASFAKFSWMTCRRALSHTGRSVSTGIDNACLQTR